MKQTPETHKPTPEESERVRRTNALRAVLSQNPEVTEACAEYINILQGLDFPLVPQGMTEPILYKREGLREAVLILRAGASKPQEESKIVKPKIKI